MSVTKILHCIQLCNFCCYSLQRVKTIGGSRGRAGCMPPLWDPILSFSHTFLLKSTHIRFHAPLTGPCPPMGNPGSATENCEFLYSVGHAIGRDAFVDEGIIVPLSKLFDDLEDIVRKNAHKAIEMVSETPVGKGR